MHQQDLRKLMRISPYYKQNLQKYSKNYLNNELQPNDLPIENRVQLQSFENSIVNKVHQCYACLTVDNNLQKCYKCKRKSCMNCLKECGNCGQKYCKIDHQWSYDKQNYYCYQCQN